MFKSIMRPCNPGQPIAVYNRYCDRQYEFVNAPMSDFQPIANSFSSDFGVIVRPTEWRIDGGLLRRIKHAYRLAIRDFNGRGYSMWKYIRRRQHDLHAALMNDDDAMTSAVLSNPARTELYYGMDSLFKVGTELLKTMEPQRGILASFVLDTLGRLSEVTGARRALNPEAPVKQQHKPDTDIEAVISSLDAVLGIRIDFPNPFDGEYGIRTSRGVMGQRGPLCLYQAWRFVNLCRLIDGYRVLEIGAGVGRQAYYARKMGITDYTIVDLPLGNVGQAIFLGTILGPDAVWMPGDAVSDQAGRIRLFPPDWINSTDENFDLIANVDSMTEMSRKQAIEYFRFSCEHCKVFLSINHEANRFRVYDLPRAAGISIGSVRHICSIRPGYVEECFINGLAGPVHRKWFWPWNRR
jgi:hypothetical protein